MHEIIRLIKAPALACDSRWAVTIRVARTGVTFGIDAKTRIDGNDIFAVYVVPRDVENRDSLYSQGGVGFRYKLIQK